MNLVMPFYGREMEEERGDGIGFGVMQVVQLCHGETLNRADHGAPLPFQH
jgi:hypothetical protein